MCHSYLVKPWKSYLVNPWKSANDILCECLGDVGIETRGLRDQHTAPGMQQARGELRSPRGNAANLRQTLAEKGVLQNQSHPKTPPE